MAEAAATRPFQVKGLDRWGHVTLRVTSSNEEQRADGSVARSVAFPLLVRCYPLRIIPVSPAAMRSKLLIIGSDLAVTARLLHRAAMIAPIAERFLRSRQLDLPRLTGYRVTLFSARRCCIGECVREYIHTHR